MRHDIEFFIHIGLPKTGTTFLQECIFKKLDGIKVFRYFDDFLSIDSFNYKKFLWSNENLSGSPQLIYDYEKKTNRYCILNNLKKFFPNAKIIIGVRKPEDWVKSIYRESVAQGCYLSFKKFRKLLNEDPLDFDFYIDVIRTNFKFVFVYNFEDLKYNKKLVINKLCSFLGCDIPLYKDIIVNSSLSKKQVIFMRFLNFFGGRKGYNKFRGLSFIKDWVYKEIRRV